MAELSDRVLPPLGRVDAGRLHDAADIVLASSVENWSEEEKDSLRRCMRALEAAMDSPDGIAPEMESAALEAVCVPVAVPTLSGTVATALRAARDSGGAA